MNIKRLTLFGVFFVLDVLVLVGGTTFTTPVVGMENEFVSYLGGDRFDNIKGTAVLDDGSIIVVGRTQSNDFPTTPGAFDRTCGNGTACGGEFAEGDAFVSKFSADGSTLIFSTFLGGNDDDGAEAVAIAPDGSIVVVGSAISTDFPTTPGAIDSTRNGFGRQPDTFVARLSSDGSQLLYGSYLGGDNQDSAFDVAVDNANNIYLVGFAFSTDFPTTAGAFDTTHGGVTDAFAAKINASGSTLLYSTFLGGDDFEAALGLAVDGAGNAFVVGERDSTVYPTTAGAFDTTRSGDQDAFVTKLNPAGSALVYSTLLGGTGSEDISDIEVDPAGNAYVIGSTLFPGDFPLTTGAYDTSPANTRDAFFTIFNAVGSNITYSSFLSNVQSPLYTGRTVNLADDGTVFLGIHMNEGAFGEDFPSFFQLDPAGNGADDLMFDCRFCYRFNKGILNDMALGPNGLVLAGETADEDFPVTPGAFDTVLEGDFDGFVIAQGTPEIADVDAYVDVPDMAGGRAGENAPLLIKYGNNGATTANNVTIVATLDPNLTYISDTSGTTPAIAGNQLTWNLSNLAFNDMESFELIVELPNVAVGSQFPIDVTINSAGPEAVPANNDDSTNMLVADLFFLPIVINR